MAAKPSNIRFLLSNTGRAHVVTTPANDRKTSKCGVVKKNHGMPVATGGWGKRKSLSPDAALAATDCAKCQTHAVAEEARQAQMTPAQKRAERKAQASETRDKLADRKRKSKSKPKATAKSSGGRRGPRSTDPAKGKELAQEHLELAQQHGWKGSVTVEGNEVAVEVTKDGQTCKLIYRDGKICWSRVTFTNGREVKLRNAGNWRKQVTLPVNKRPGQAGAKPRGNSKRASKAVAERNHAAKPEDEVDGAHDHLPFTLEDDPATIIEALAGRLVTWRSALTGKVDMATVPARSRNVRVTTHPKSTRKIISFHEVMASGDQGDVLGGERSIYLDKIIEVSNTANTRYDIHYLAPGANKTACGADGWIGQVRNKWAKVDCDKCLAAKQKVEQDAS